MSKKKERPHCYVDHANKKSENFAANPYRFWLNQVKRQRERRELENDVTDGCVETDPVDS